MVMNREYDTEIKRRNFIRAAMLAEREKLGEEAIKSARDQAFKQLLGEWFNFRAAETLARKWSFSQDDVVRLCNELINGFEQRGKRDGRDFKVFDINRMDHTTATMLVSQFRNAFH